MGKTLIVAEKPSVAADIAKALGGNFKQVERNVYESSDVVVTSARGHCVEIGIDPEHDKGWALSALPVIPPEFKLGVIKDSGSFLKTIRDQIRRMDVETVVNACDAGREGELIFGLIVAYLGCRKPMKRMWLQSMTHDAIREAYATMKPSSSKTGLLDAAKCRAEADLLVGFNGTRALTNLYRQQTGGDGIATAGRVQTPVLALICDRENAIRTFKPRDFWEVHGTFKVQAGTYTGKWHRPKGERSVDTEDKADRLWSQEEAQAVAQRCQGRAPTAVHEKKEPVSSAPPKLFDLTSLQREANKRFGFTASMTLKIAQALYETHKVLTYPRTDSSALPEDYVDTARQLLAHLGEQNPHAQRVVDSDWVKPDKRIFNNAKISDHFAIIPTMTRATSLSKEENDVYTLVVQRFIAAFHPPAQYERTTRWTELGEDKFLSTGRVLVKEGWIAVYGRDLNEEDESKQEARLCPYTLGEPVATESVKVVQGKTKPPSRFTDATLLGAMETAGKLVSDEAMREAMAERGLGTPATRASIIEGLLSPKRGYLAREKKEIVPTSKALEVIGVLRAIGLEALTSPALTGEWEAKLLHIEQGKAERAAFMRDIQSMAREIVEHIREKSAVTPQKELPTLKAVCPQCGGTLAFGDRTVNCKSCDFKLWRVVAGKQLDAGQVERLLAGETLPEMKGFKSSAGKLFSAGLRFAAGKIEFVFPPREQRPPRDLSDAKACPSCGTGKMLERKGPKGAFMGCSNYPKCKHTEQVGAN